MKRLAIALIALGVLATPSVAQGQEAPQPSVVLIVTDDQRFDTVTPEFTPNIYRLFVQGGTWYPNAFIPNPLCCPSRTSILTGNYSHTTGVYANAGEWGGAPAFSRFGNQRSTLATDFDAAGYRTGLVGKYLNHHPIRDVPPGWDWWRSVSTGAFYDYQASIQGRPRWFGDKPWNYSTRVLERWALDFLARPGPSFLYLAPTAPHAPATPDQRDVGRFTAELPPTPSFGHVSANAPKYMDLGWGSRDDASIRELATRQIESMYAVDRMVGKVWDAAPTGTVFLFLSDNGFLWGEHRWTTKTVPYNESLRVPMGIAAKNDDVMFGEPIPAGVEDPRIVLNVDIRETLNALAGLPVPTTEGEDIRTVARDDFVLEHVGKTKLVPTYCGVRGLSWMYARYVTGEEELYVEDPFEVTNVAQDPAYAEWLAFARLRADALCSEGEHHPTIWTRLEGR